MAPRNTWIKTIAAGIVIGAAVAATHVTSLGERIEFAAYDLCHRLAPGPSPMPDIVIIAIDDESLSRLGGWPWPRSYYSRLLGILAKEKARAIGIDILMPEVSTDPAADRALAAAAALSGRTVFPFYSESKVLPRGSQVFHATGQRRLPYAELARSSLVGSVVAVPDPDGILRRHLPVILDEGRPFYSMDLELARLYLGLPSSEVSFSRSGLRVGPVRVPLDSTGRVFVKYSSGAPGGPGYKTVPCYRVLNGEFTPGEFEGKIVLVGVRAQGLHDFYFTPLSSAGNPVPGVEVHANTVQALLEGRMVKGVPESLLALTCIGAAVILTAMFRGLHPARAGAISCAAGILAALLSFVLFSRANVWADPTPIIGVVAVSLARQLATSFIIAENEKARVRATFSRYVSPAVVDEVLRAREEVSLGGRRLDITVMFADLRGFTAFAERESPERVVDVLNAHLSMIAEAIFREGGTLDKFTGDGVMAVFGAPVPQEDHALRAARAAIAIREASRRQTTASDRGDGVWLPIGVGMASGEAVVGNIGTLARMDYTAVGDVANLAARLESIAGPGQVLMCARTYGALCGRVAAETVGSITVRGRSSPVDIYQLL
ncbi:MAG: adenylate/guanylate cyclase domain-containing protein [Bacillota bacterium]